MTIELEQRTLVEPVEFRSADGGRLIAAGVAMRYGVKSKRLGGGTFRELFEPRSLAKTLSEQDVLACHEHDERLYLGRSGAGTLRFADSKEQLEYEIDLPDTMVGRDVATLMERGDVRGSSIAFRAIPGQTAWTVDDDGIALRTVREARLRHLSTTVQPAYGDSTADLALRSLAEERSLDPALVLGAADAAQLAALLTPSTDPSGQDEQRRQATLLRPHLGWLTA